MSKRYDDARYGIEKTICLAEVDMANAPATTILRSIYFSEDITITEIQFLVTGVISTMDASAAGVTLNVSGGNPLATLSLTSAVVSGNLFRTTTIATPAAISNNSVLQLVVSASCSLGKGVPYIKYRERF